MPNKIWLTVILPPEEDPGKAQPTLSSLRPLVADLQILHWSPALPLSGFSETTRLSGAPLRGFAQLLNQALKLTQGEFVVVLPPELEVSADLADRLRVVLQQTPEVRYVYGDYFTANAAGERRLVRANSCPEDVTEREDWGPLEFYRVTALRRLGGADPTLHFRADYDLRLKLGELGSLVYLPQPLCTLPQPESSNEIGAQTLFFPGRGKFGGFSYLFMDPAEEKEVEEIFYCALRRRGAFLEHAPGGIFPAVPRRSPRVSVVMPVHNRAEFLPLSLGSVQQGTFPDFEIVIVDNASTDSTLSVAQELAARDPRIHVISLPDNVIAKALNVGVSHARGEYIAQLDSDDEYTPSTLETMVAHLDQRPEEALAISYYELMNQAGETLTEFGVIKHLEYNRNNLLRVDGAGAVRVWRKAAIVEAGGFNEADFGHYGEDYDLVCRVAEKYEVGRVHEILYRYRRHPGNSDALRPPAMKIQNKTLARLRALKRRQALNART